MHVITQIKKPFQTLHIQLNRLSFVFIKALYAFVVVLEHVWECWFWYIFLIKDTVVAMLSILKSSLRKLLVELIGEDS